MTISAVGGLLMAGASVGMARAHQLLTLHDHILAASLGDQARNGGVTIARAVRVAGVATPGVA